MLTWFDANKIIVNSEKFLALIFEKRQDHANMHILIDTQNVKAEPSAKLLGAEIDGKLNFSLDIILSAMIRLKNYLSSSARKLLINIYFMSDFSYYELVLIFSSFEFLKRIKYLQERVL